MPVMLLISSLLSFNLPIPEWSLSIRGGFVAARILNGEEPGFSSWKKHAPFPLDSLDSLDYHYDESFAVTVEAEAGYRGFWLGACMGAGEGNEIVQDTAGESVGFSNPGFADMSFCLGYDLSARMGLSLSGLAPFCSGVQLKP